MAQFKPLMGSRASLDTQDKCEGYVYFCVDDGTFHIDYVDAEGVLQRKQINAKEAESLLNFDIVTVLGTSDTEIPTSKAVKTAIDTAVATYITSALNTEV